VLRWTATSAAATAAAAELFFAVQLEQRKGGEVAKKMVEHVAFGEPEDVWAAVL
jgi:hypothetical protein